MTSWYGIAKGAADAATPGLQGIDGASIMPAIQEIFSWVRTGSSEIFLLAGIAFLVFLALVAIKSWVVGLLRRLEHRARWIETTRLAISRTSLAVLLLASFTIVINGAAPPAILAQTFRLLFTIVMVLQAAAWAQTILVGLLEIKGAQAEDASALNLFRSLLTGIIWTIAILTLLANLGVNITGLIAGLGIGGIAIGFAAQGILGDLFAAFAILLDKPFKRGDTITYEPGQLGRVEEIGVKSTRLRALNGELVVVPNARLLSASLANFAEFERRRVVQPFGVIYETSPELLERIPKEIEAIVGTVPRASFDRCHFVNFGAYSLDFELVFFVESPELVEMLTARQQVLLGIVRRFADLGISFAYPVQVEMVAGPDGKVIDPRAADLGGGATALAGARQRP
ncbi:mechanosensitive ion channel family protein [Thermaurantiacus sp.]